MHASAGIASFATRTGKPSMGYYLRIFSRSGNRIPLATLRNAVPDCSIAPNDGSDGWTSFDLCLADGAVAAKITRDDRSGTLLSDEVEEFVETLEDAEPRSGATWTIAFLREAVVVYAIQVLEMTEKAWSAIGAVKAALWNTSGGILQADNEGFSNLAGYHITWDFSDDVDGSWWMAVLENGEWRKFAMQLGNREHREAFRAGRVPAGATLDSA